jgi:hypothetical protein
MLNFDVMLKGASPRQLAEQDQVDLTSTRGCTARTHPRPCDEEAMESRQLPREHVLLTEPLPTFGESPELE